MGPKVLPATCSEAWGLSKKHWCKNQTSACACSTKQTETHPSTKEGETSGWPDLVRNNMYSSREDKRQYERQQQGNLKWTTWAKMQILEEKVPGHAWKLQSVKWFLFSLDQFQIRVRHESFPEALLASSNLTSSEGRQPISDRQTGRVLILREWGQQHCKLPCSLYHSICTRGRLSIATGSWEPVTQAGRHVQRTCKERENYGIATLMKLFDHVEMRQYQIVAVATLGQTKKPLNAFDKSDAVCNNQPESVILGRSLPRRLWYVYTKQTAMATCTINALQSSFTHICKARLLCFTPRQWHSILPTNLASATSKLCFQSLKNFMQVVFINWCSLSAANYLPLHDFLKAASCSSLLLVYYYMA